MSIGAFPLSFDPPSSCFPTDIWQLSFAPESRTYELLGPPLRTECFPSGYNPSTTAYYSPGQCPTGYSVASSTVITAGSVTETAQFCCPSFARDMTFEVQHFTGETIFRHVTTLMCNSGWFDTRTLTVTASTDTGRDPETKVVTKVGGAINAYGIQVKFQEGDFDGSSSTAVLTMASSRLQTSTPSPTQISSTPTQTSSSASTTSPSSSSGGLSSGAKIGIGVGVTAGVLGIALAVALGYIFGKRRAQHGDARKNELEGYDGYDAQMLKASWGPPPVELEVRPVEVDAGPRSGKHELGGSGRE